MRCPYAMKALCFYYFTILCSCIFTKVLTLYNQVAEVGYAIIRIIISYIPGGPYAVEDFSLLLSSLTPKHPSRKCVSRVNVMCWNAVKTFQGTFTAFHLPAPSICPPVHFLKINVGGTSPQLNDPFGLFVPPL